MKLNKTFGRIATTLVATAMLASVAAPVYAEPTDGGEQVAPSPIEYKTGASFSLDKVVEKEQGVYSPVTDFRFKITAAIAGSNETVDNGLPVSNGDMSVFPDVQTDDSGTPGDPSDDVEYALLTAKYETAGHLEDSEVSVPTGTVTLRVGDIKAAGVYKYAIQELDDGYEGVAYDTTVRDLYVYIGYAEDSTDLSVLYTVVVDKTATDVTNGKTDTITNEYGVGDAENLLGELSIEKKVTGNQGDPNATFSFSIKIDGATGEKYRATVYNWQDPVEPETEGSWVASTTTYDIESDAESATGILLKDGQKVVITGLSANDQYTIYEEEADKNGYITTVSGTDSNDKVTNNVKISESLTVNDQIVGKIATVSSDDALDVVADKAIVFENNRATTAPTGLIMDIAPYVLLVVVAAAGCFVFLRKRRED